MRTCAWFLAAVLAGCGGNAPAPQGSGSGSGGSAKHALNIHIVGSGTVDGGSFSCTSDCAQSLDSAATLTATPAAGFDFAGWQGACSGTAGCALPMTADADVTATFTSTPPPPPPVQRTLTVTVSGQGTVSSSPSGIQCPGTCSATFADGATVKLTASGAVTWGGACNGGGGCSVTLNADESVSALFAAPPPPPPDACAGLMPGSPGTPVTGTVDFSGQSKTGCYLATSDLQGDVGAFLGQFGPDPWTVWTAGGAKSPNHFDSADVVALDSGFMGQGYDGARRIEMVWSADGSLVTSEPPIATDAMTVIENFPAITGGSVVLGRSCHAGIDAGMGLVVYRFDGSGRQVSAVGMAGTGCAATNMAATVDTNDRTLVALFTGGAGALGFATGRTIVRWFDRAGNALTDWADVGLASGEFPLARPLIGGGAAIAAGGFQWAGSFQSGMTRMDPPPSFAANGSDLRIVRGGKAYAVVPVMKPSIELYAPGGKDCGALQIPNARNLQIGLDGTVIDLNGKDGCTLHWWSGLLR